MSDRIRQVLAYVLAMGIIAAVAAVPTVAQETDPNAERIFELAGLNADKVDGRHAVKYTTTKSRRAGKLVAANSKGYLPANIVKPKWGLISGKPAGFADGVDNAGVTQVLMRYVRVNGSIPGNSYGDLNIPCPADYLVTGGGIGQASSDVRILDSEPWGEYGWIISGLNLGSAKREISGYAVCISAKPNSALKNMGWWYP